MGGATFVLSQRTALTPLSSNRTNPNRWSMCRSGSGELSAGRDDSTNPASSPCFYSTGKTARPLEWKWGGGELMLLIHI